MKDELFEIIASAIIDVSLNNIQNFLIVRNKKIEKMIGEVPDKKIMTGFCTTYFSLSNVTALKELAQCCKVDHIANRFNALLKKRNIFYEKILAKDFAMKSIVDHDGMCEANATVSQIMITCICMITYSFFRSLLKFHGIRMEQD